MRTVTRFLSILLATCLAVNVGAASYIQISIQQVSEQAELIFEGQVISKQSAMTGANQTIHTTVTFEVLDIIKGVYKSRYLALSYLGGTVGDLTMDVAEVSPPALGEHGIYFVESISRRLAHPLLGGDQGHFLIKKDAGGREYVTARSGQKVMALATSPGASPQISQGAVTGLQYDSPTSTGTAMSVAEFKGRVKRLGEGK